MQSQSSLWKLEFVARLSCSKGLSLSYYKYSEEDKTFIELEWSVPYKDMHHNIEVSVYSLKQLGKRNKNTANTVGENKHYWEKNNLHIEIVLLQIIINRVILTLQYSPMLHFLYSHTKMFKMMPGLHDSVFLFCSFCLITYTGHIQCHFSLDNPFTRHLHFQKEFL